MAEDPAAGVPAVDINKFALSFPLVLVGWPSKHRGMARKPFSSTIFPEKQIPREEGLRETTRQRTHRTNYKRGSRVRHKYSPC